MKKLDKLILKEFLGPFVLTSAVMLFIFLTQYMIKNFKHLVGKDLGFDVIGQLFLYFGMVMIPVALPIAVLLSTLMTYGNLGQHSELTAIKSAGVTLPRILVPVGIFCLLLTGFGLWYNETVVPKASLQGYSLLYDVKQKKPALELKEGAFYGGIENYNIKVDEKGADGKSLTGLVIYNHSNGRGNTEVILAESGYMQTVMNDSYLQLDLYNGNSYSEVKANRNYKNRTEYVRNEFDSAIILFSLAEFALQQTDKDLFLGHDLMKHQPELRQERDSLQQVLNRNIDPYNNLITKQYLYWNQPDSLFKTRRSAATITQTAAQIAKPYDAANATVKYRVALNTLNKAKGVHNLVNTQASRTTLQRRDVASKSMSILKRYSQAIAIFVMFLIGAPLGAIIKKGGLGIPVLASVAFFVIYYISTITGDKMAKELVIQPEVGAWAANVGLGLVGVFFLIQAQRDVRLFDADYYQVLLGKLSRKKKTA